MTPLGGTCPYRYCGGFVTTIFFSTSTNYRFLLFSKLLTRGFSFQFHFLLWTFFQISENSSVDMLIKTLRNITFSCC